MMGGLARLAKMHGSIVIQGQRFVWDYVADKAIPEKDMPCGSKRHVLSEKAKYALLQQSTKRDW